MKKAGQPFLFTHTALRKYYKAERGIAKWMIDEIKNHEGMVGLVPSEEMILDTEGPKNLCPRLWWLQWRSPWACCSIYRIKC